MDSAATISGNEISDTKRPGMMIYGSSDRGRLSIVEANLIRGSRCSSGIVIGGGPAVVRGNVARDDAEAGIVIEDYGGPRALA